jgi:large subunit ribosomal protein L6
MSKLALFYINKPSTVFFEYFKWTQTTIILRFRGAYGSIYYNFFNYIFFDYKNATQFYILLNPAKKELKKFLGLLYTLCFSALQDISLSYKYFLEMKGIGFKVYIKKKTLILDIGYSHQIFLTIPSFLFIKILNKKNTKFLIHGFYRQKVREFANIIKLTKFPNEYTLKGIHYKNEIIIKKEGKQAQQK